MAASLNWMRNSDITGFEQPFIYELDVFGHRITQELVENGYNLEVNNTNKNLFISSFCKAKAFNGVKQQVQSFKDGFFAYIPDGFLDIFSPGEIDILISGKSEIDREDFKKNTIYKDLSKQSDLVSWFWDIVEIMDQDMLANLLFFITGKR